MSADRERIPQRQLGELMTDLGLISEEQLATVLEVQQQSKRPLGQIIVELGFASGAAVAHALAMQSGGALKTEYGFALGVGPNEADPEGDEARASEGLPKLRLAASAVVPPVRIPLEEPELESSAGEELATPPEPTSEPTSEPEPVVELEELAETEEAEEVAEAEAVEAPEVDELPEVEEVVEIEEVPEIAEVVEVEAPEVTVAEAEATEETPPTVAPAELEELRAEVERLEAALAEVQSSAAAEQEQLRAELTRLESARTETDTAREEELVRLREEHERATTELERLQTALYEAETGNEQLARLQEAHGTATAELARLQTAVAEARTADAEHERRLVEEQERHSAELDELAGQRDRLQQELGDTLERLVAADAATEERDRLRTEVEQFEATLTEAQAAATTERERLLNDVDRLESALAEAQSAREQELESVRDAHRETREQLERVQTGLAEAQTSVIEHERRLADEQERHSVERDELSGQRDRLQQELGDTLERLAVLGPAAEEREGLRSEVERLEATLAEAKKTFASELLDVTEERETVTAELEEARELLVQAERVRESQIALEAERDRAVSELERLRTVAAEARAEAEEQNRVLAEEQDRHHAERESLLGQRTLLEQELGNAIEQLAAVGTAADEREARLRNSSQQLVDALDAVRRLAAELVAGVDEIRDESEPAATPADPVEMEAGAPEDDAEAEEVEYSLFVPGPNGYDLVPQTGVPPQAGQTVELFLTDQDEPVVYEVARSGRTLPDGDICVYLAQV